jgi:hypothetical protein
MRQEQVEDEFSFAHSSGTIVQISLLGKLKPADLDLAEIGLLVRKSGAARA